ncbi:dihydroorotate dehydrogenase electron transfer subunit [Salisediminibacterium halotolerans]|uniref:Dihydroorotate dehydrogenase B (NAD(+)), electron transfer subunit n=1 Tax=Salisediminibacterium halotolerans TaxID=517425 RepID=A0A1H9PYI8_9BACI|nr:dihydroorotate dehydrogenase electron transfer subunit [Salisediminibacterium haloalkalitolerans]SER52653.1 dihydroorotate dehydrogenase electron transfer subunit [Salisediminibacterium haloalkalitolerans]
MKTADFKVISHRQIADHIFQLILTGEEAANMTEPGQFVHVQIPGKTAPLLRRPLSIADAEPAAKQCTLIYRAEGPGTKQLAAAGEGDVVNLLGPLGNGFTSAPEQDGKAVLIGGGIGVPPLYYLAKRFAASGIALDIYLGFRTKGDVFLQKAFADLGQTTITTEDGSFGEKGYVTDQIKALRGNETFYACGPRPMLRAVQEAAESKAYLSLEERMACGVGACLSCVCESARSVNSPYVKICSDGPVFNSAEVKI